eukprot:g8838.t1
MSLVGIELRFHKEETEFPTWYEGESGSQQHPCFVAVGQRQSEDGTEYHCESYQFYFEHNYGIGLFRASPKAKSLGYHKHDVEGIVVLFEKETKEPKHVYFKAHGTGQGSWRRWEECEKTPEGSLVVYIAWGSHATYPTAKEVTRIFGLANDRVSSNGEIRIITQNDFVPAKPVKFGKGIAIHNEIPALPNRSIMKLERMALPLLQTRVKKRAK